MSSFIEWKDMKIIYKRYASLYFCAAVDVRSNTFILIDFNEIFPKSDY